MSAKCGWGAFRRAALALCRLVCIACLIFLPAVTAAAKKKPPSRPIDINVANVKELEELPGVGPTTAQAIIDTREKSGKFKRVEDLLVIHGISPTKLDRMRAYVTVGPAAKPAATTAPAAGHSSGTSAAASARSAGPGGKPAATVKSPTPGAQGSQTSSTKAAPQS